MKTVFIKFLASIAFGIAALNAVDVSALALTGIKSRKVHGPAGVFDHSIDGAQAFTGPVTVEPRSIGTGHVIVFQFDGTVTSVGSATSMDASGPIGSVSVAITGATNPTINNEVSVTLTGIPDGRRVSISLTQINGTLSVGPVSLGFLLGDVDNSRSVDSTDISLVSARSGEPTVAANFLFDLNVSGAVNSADIATVRARSGLALISSSNTYAVTPSAGLNGLISPSSIQNVVFATNQSFTVTPAAGYTASVAGTCGGILVGSTYTTQAITAPCTVAATFAPTAFALDISKLGTGNGTVASSPAGINCGVTCNANFAQATSVTLSAAANLGSNFTGWSGACAGAAAAVTVVMNANKSCNATFTVNSYSVTPSAGSNGSISPLAVQTVVHGSNTTFTIAANAGFAASVGGTCGGSLVGTTYTTNPITAPCTVIATFNSTSFSLGVSRLGSGTGTVTSAPAGINCGTTCTANFNQNASVTLSAVASTGSTFAGWSGACSGTAGSFTTVMNANKTCSATFTLNTSTVTPSAGINGSITPSTFQTISYGTTTSFTVTPAAGYVAMVGGTCGGALVGTTYTTNPIVVQCTVAATFTSASVNVSLVVSKLGTGTGTVTTIPAGINCGATCTANFPQNTSVTVSAVAAAGSTFTGWSGVCSGAALTSTFVMAANGTCSATFAPNTLSITPSAGANGSISPASVQTTAPGVTKVFTITPIAGFTASVGGTCGGVLVGTTYTTNTITASCTVSATFAASSGVSLTVANAGTGTGTVTSTPPGINCGVTCNANFNLNSSVALSAAASAGSIFSGWSGVCTGTAVTSTFVMTANGTCNATFTTTTPSGSAILTWDPVIDPSLSGYRVYYGTSPGIYIQPSGAGINVGNVSTFTVTGLNSGTRYYFVVTAFSTSNIESSDSLEVSKQMP